LSSEHNGFAVQCMVGWLSSYLLVSKSIKLSGEQNGSMYNVCGTWVPLKLLC